MNRDHSQSALVFYRRLLATRHLLPLPSLQIMLGVCRESDGHVLNHAATFRAFGNDALAARPALLSHQISTDSSSEASTPELAPQKSFSSASLQFGFPNPLAIVHDNNYYALRTTSPYATTIQEPETQTTKALPNVVVVQEQKSTHSERLKKLPVVKACTMKSKKSASKSRKNVAVAIAVNDLELGAKMLLELGAHHIGGPKCSNGAVTQDTLAAAVAAATTAVVDVDDSDSDESRIFPCGSCDKLFNKRSDLQRHARVHSGERPFNCPKCHKSFKERFGLKRHIRTHTGERPYGCHVCGRRFAEAGNLRRHVRLHSGDRPFACLSCGKAFAQRSNHKKHFETCRRNCSSE